MLNVDKLAVRNYDTPFDEKSQALIMRFDTLSGKKITLERQVNFFVLALEQAEAIIRFTCGGHPTGFNIVFDGEYDLAFLIKRCGYFDISLMRERNRFRMDLRGNEARIERLKGKFTEDDRDRILSFASLAWVRVGLDA